MTYYLSRDREDEVSARVEYLYRVFHTHFLRCADAGGFVCLKSFPFQDDGICFVTAHNNQAYSLLSMELDAETVVLNCCFPKQFKEFVGKYRVYFCKVDERGYARFRRAIEYGTGFDILDSELLMLYSKKADVLGKVRDAYSLLGGKA